MKKKEGKKEKEKKKTFEKEEFDQFQQPPIPQEYEG